MRASLNYNQLIPRYFNFRAEVEEEESPKSNTWAPRTLSAIDISNSLKDFSESGSIKKIPQEAEKTSNTTFTE
ncbi:hypothetical protein NPIL_453931, partial [Nephila pilipes]